MASIATVNASSNAPFHPSMHRVWNGLAVHLLVWLQNQYPNQIGYYDEDLEGVENAEEITDDICDDNNYNVEVGENAEEITDDICDDNYNVEVGENVEEVADVIFADNNYDGIMSECASEAVKQELWDIAKSLPDDLEMFFRVPREAREDMLRDYFINWDIHTEIREALTEEAITCFIDSCELLRAIFLYGEDGASEDCLARNVLRRAQLAAQGQAERQKHIVELTKLALPETQADADTTWDSYFRTLLLVTYDKEEQSQVKGAVYIHDLEEQAQIQISLAMWLITIESLFDLCDWVDRKTLQNEYAYNEDYDVENNAYDQTVDWQYAGNDEEYDDGDDGDDDNDQTVRWQKVMLGRVEIFNTDEYTKEEKEFSTLPFRRALPEYIVSEDVANAMFALVQAYNNKLRQEHPLEQPQQSEDVDVDSGIVEEEEPVDQVTEKLAALAAFYPEL